MGLVDGDTVTVVRDTLDALLVYHVRCSAFCSYVLLCLYQYYFRLFLPMGALIVTSYSYELLIHCPFVLSLILTLLCRVSLIFDLVLSYHSC